jgi:hypothetical protein
VAIPATTQLPRHLFKSMTAGCAFVTMFFAVSGCNSHGTSSPESSAYCTDLEQAQSNFGNLNSGDFGKLGAAFVALHQLNQEAPPALRKEWLLVDETITDLDTAVDDAGLKLSDLGDIRAGNVPKNVGPAKLRKIAEKSRMLAGSRVTHAASAIEADAQSQCGFDVSIF